MWDVCIIKSNAEWPVVCVLEQILRNVVFPDTEHVYVQIWGADRIRDLRQQYNSHNLTLE